MNAPKFTPGPWEWRMEVQDRGIGKGNSRYAALGAPRDGHPKLRQGVAVPNWSEADGGVWQAWITVAPANANLIVAAPELYALAVRVAKYFADTDAPLGVEARAAIAKARGETP